MSARDDVLAALRGAAVPGAERPPVPERPGPPADLLAALRASLEAAGGTLVPVERADAATLERVLPGFAGARHVWSALPGLASRGVAAQPCEPAALAELDYCVLAGRLVVAESGAVWNEPDGLTERAAALLAEHLVLVVPRAAVVANLHDAYARIDPGAGVFGWFLAGPSKTADIEQSLVLGAHGPRALTLLLAD